MVDHARAPDCRCRNLASAYGMPLFGLARGGECWGGFDSPAELVVEWGGPHAAAWGGSCGLPCPAQTEGEPAPCGGPDSAAVFYQVSSSCLLLP
jgi:hypothetical protein